MTEQKKKIKVVEDDSNIGIYVWKLDTGEIFGDEDGNILNIPSVRFDLEKMKIISEAARYWGAPPGRPHFMGGVGRITDAQYEEDMERTMNGLTPYGDTGAWREEFRKRR